MGLFGKIIGGLFGGETKVTQTSENKSQTTVGVTTTVNVDTQPLASAFENIGTLTTEGQQKLAEALNIMGTAELAQANAQVVSNQRTLNFLQGIWDKTSRATVAIVGIVAVYLLFFKKG